MGSQTLQLPQNYQVIVDRFVAVCQADVRVVAAFLRGSYTTGKADDYSDLDLGLITTDEGFEGFVAERQTFMRLLGEPLFVETFNLPNFIFFFFSNGTEGELSVGRTSDFNQINRGSYQTLLDKTGILTGTVFTGNQPTQAEQLETARRFMYWFWHDLSHFIVSYVLHHDLE
jgi:predicted nucleotidyltransferase